MEGKTNF